MHKTILPPARVTAVIRNDAPLFHCGSSSTFRTVSIELTAEQRAALALRETHGNSAGTFYEEISMLISEPDDTTEPTP